MAHLKKKIKQNVKLHIFAVPTVKDRSSKNAKSDMTASSSFNCILNI